MEQAIGREPVVVLVEDDPADSEQFVRVASRLEPAVRIIHAKDLEEGARLIEAARASDDLRLVVLDFRLGEENALEMLAKVRAPHDVLRVPVVIFTGQASPQEMDLAERIGANSVIRKPDD